jgi:hypothetical protein
MAQRFVCPIHPRRPPRHNPSLSTTQHPLLPPSSPHSPFPPDPLLPLSLFHLILKTDARFILFWPSCPPPPSLILSPNAQSKMKQRTYESPSERSTICATARSSTLLHTRQALAVRISPASSNPVMLNPSRISSLSAYAGALDRILVQLSNAHYSNSCLGGPRGGRGLVFPRLDHPCCRDRPPGI